MLAWQSPQTIRELYRGTELAPPARGATLSIDSLLDELVHTRERGYSVDDEGVREGVHCIGAPVFDASGAVVAGVGVCIQKASINAPTRDKHLDTVQRAARQLTQRIGGRVPAQAATQGHPDSPTTPTARAA